MFKSERCLSTYRFRTVGRYKKIKLSTKPNRQQNIKEGGGRGGQEDCLVTEILTDI